MVMGKLSRDLLLIIMHPQRSHLLAHDFGNLPTGRRKDQIPEAHNPFENLPLIHHIKVRDIFGKELLVVSQSLLACLD